MYYSEILRLQSVTDKLQSELNGEIPQTKKYMRNKMDEQSRVIKRMKERTAGMATELTNLKKQLGLWREGKAIIDEHETGA